MDDKKMVRRRIISIILLVLALYLVVLSPFSGRAVAQINGGYGTFDMKKYDADLFINVMRETSNVDIFWKYYVCDCIFTAAFLNFMIQMVSGFKGEFISKVKVLSYFLAVIRGLLDFSENTVLLNQIYSYPIVNRMLIDTCNTITRIKFLFMRGWFVCFILMCLVQFVKSKLKKRGQYLWNLTEGNRLS